MNFIQHVSLVATLCIVVGGNLSAVTQLPSGVTVQLQSMNQAESKTFFSQNFMGKLLSYFKFSKPDRAQLQKTIAELAVVHLKIQNSSRENVTIPANTFDALKNISVNPEAIAKLYPNTRQTILATGIGTILAYYLPFYIAFQIDNTGGSHYINMFFAFHNSCELPETLYKNLSADNTIIRKTITLIIGSFFASVSLAGAFIGWKLWSNSPQKARIAHASLPQGDVTLKPGAKLTKLFLVKRSDLDSLLTQTA